MIKKIILLLLTSLLILSSLPFSYSIQDEGVTIDEFEPNVVLVQFNQTINEHGKSAIQAELGLTIKKQLKKEGLYLMKLEKNKDVLKVIEKLNKKKEVLYAEPNYKLYAIDTGVAEPDFDKLWGLVNSNDIDINADEAWVTTYGTNDVIVAVIDTGADINHVDLNGQFLLTNNINDYNFATGVSEYYIPADDDHGTHVAGTIAASDNGLGIIGVAPNVKIMPLKFLGPNGGYTSDAILAINYAAENGANVINASWGGGSYSNALYDAINDFPGIFVAAAGNSGKNTDKRPHYPSSYDSDNIISVAAIDSSGAKPRFSNYGRISVDVGAPGVSIYSTLPEDNYNYYNGTSMAAPHVTGTIALMLSVDPSLKDGRVESITKIKDALFTSVKPLDSLAGKTVTGGMIDAKAALAALEPQSPDVTPPEFISVDPESGNFALGQSIVYTFNENLMTDYQPGITITNNVPYNYSYNGNTLIITPEFIEGNAYDVTLTSVKDTAGNIFTGNISTTYSVVQPEVFVNMITGTMPADKARNITSNEITVIFDTSYTNIQLVNLTGLRLVDKLSGEIYFSNNYELSDTQIVLTTESALLPNMRYTLKIDVGTFSSNQGLSNAYQSVFTTSK